MKLRTRSRVDLPGVTGTLRVDRRTPALLRRLRPGDVAVLDHLDLDRATAEELVERQVVAVVNAAPFLSGRYPALGPELLAASGVVLVEAVGPEALERLKDGARVRVHEGEVLVGEEVLARGRALDRDAVAADMDAAREGLATQLQSFTANTTEFLRREQELLLHGRGAPRLETRVDGRAVVVVVREFDHREDLDRLRRWIREQDPVLVGVDDGADVLLEAGHRPDVVVVGEAGLADGPHAVSEKALRAAREVVLHTDAAGRAQGAERLDRLGVRRHRIAAGATTADVALLLADLAGAALIVTVGAHASLDEFLDRQREGLAGTFLTRLRVGTRLVDARSVPLLYAGRVRLWQVLLVLLAGLLAVAAAASTTPAGADWWDQLTAVATDLTDRLRGLLP